jgi:uncharacterized cupredoxin-like copper-binding protein
MTRVEKSQFRKRWLTSVGVGAVLVLAASGCGSSSSKTNPSSSPTSGGTVAPGSGTRVTASETEYKIVLSTGSFTAGPYTFNAVNNGKIIHSLEIDGPGVHAVTGDIEPGQSASLSVQLQAGKYDVFCPIPGHKALGMNKQITVTAGSGAAGAAATTKGSIVDGY